MLSSTRTTVGDDATVATPRWVVFACGGERFGVPAGATREILDRRAAVRIPGCGSDVAGLINVRGRVVSVFDFRRLAQDRVPEGEGGQILVLESEGRVIGLLVDRTVAVAASGVREPEAEASGAPRLPVLGGGVHDGLSFTALDVRKMMTMLLR